MVIGSISDDEVALAVMNMKFDQPSPPSNHLCTVLLLVVCCCFLLLACWLLFVVCCVMLICAVAAGILLNTLRQCPAIAAGGLRLLCSTYACARVLSANANADADKKADATDFCRLVVVQTILLPHVPLASRAQSQIEPNTLGNAKMCA